MRVLIIGGGGREHAMAWLLKRSPSVEKVFCAPGNAGIAAEAECVALDATKHAAVAAFVREKGVGLTVIGPEAPLVDGLADSLRAAGGLVFGPGRSAARLEGSKAFAKKFMVAHGIPTADYREFTSADSAMNFVRSSAWPESLRVVKADGLAAGKGVVVARDRAEVLAALEEIMVRRAFGSAGDRVVLEEALVGEELSVMALVAGGAFVPLMTTQDHKRVFDGDQGPNTGGMGAYGPVPQVDAALWARIQKEVLERFVAGVQKDGLDYRGVIYAGLMLTPSGPKVLEFNVRFGDPETQVILPMIDGDGLAPFLATAEGRLGGADVRVRAGAALTVVLASGGYPGVFAKGRLIEGLGEDDGSSTVFHAGTTAGAGGGVATSGGRVLTVTGWGANLREARDRAYRRAGAIRFEGVHFRRDIGDRALRFSERSC
jgi:phosphoribosylamine--glycine ligase